MDVPFRTLQKDQIVCEVGFCLQNDRMQYQTLFVRDSLKIIIILD